MNPSPILELQQVSKSYGRIKALKAIDLCIPPGSVFGILGPNGSGKTTLLSIVLDVLAADKGRYLWFGQEGGPEVRRKIGSLLETPNFYHYLSGEDNLRVTSSISGRGQSPEAITKALQIVKLEERRKSRFSTYSLGMKQRLAIAAALLGDPAVLVFDEPTNGLDPVGIAEIRELIRQLHAAGHTIIMASHLLDEVEKVCSHMAILKSGQIITTGSVEEVLADEDIVEVSAADNTQLAAILDHTSGLKRLEKEQQVLLLYFEKGMADPAKINQLAWERGITLKHLSVRKKRLETRFFELTNN
ncbi:ABC transporter ATP-binding protein [Flavihumibacter petaseus]|uniref:Putative ABC transporter ATP-binding protein n=1 Tax=Flavihumibacter petaseus NBRC 106054 TaxID=1220578 RepID=A0A0E9N556_9BACT|nr:ABC transporter ATP-binding protein [Flavihumibacter petaseus]GAO44949.1 putative ABC transporter ATP-binding protein [Flavihumibacter petaseus NBRC 106054]